MKIPPKKRKNGKTGIDFSGLFSSSKTDSEKIQSFGVVLESIDSNMKLVLEVVTSTEERLGGRIDHLENQMNQRFDRIMAIANLPA